LCQATNPFKPTPVLAKMMSRENPLAPLYEEMEREGTQKQAKYALARTRAGWFMTILMIGWVSKYAFGVL